MLVSETPVLISRHRVGGGGVAADGGRNSRCGSSFNMSRHTLLVVLVAAVAVVAALAVVEVAVAVVAVAAVAMVVAAAGSKQPSVRLIVTRMNHE